ncbi:PepSY-associated TM helix domain-containing protein [Pedobacter cryoconitis]|uniref:PepSY-associated TM helix domain-containing protein n=1 Tax=Pedobacter cryoconitis TaxID=188932 RepID=UPI0016096DCC|nr:PepSY-associated TM helix domain-containing protein [Pedobacter cryoconitis]MBB5645713.1 putative iron-regulated membrane protein [Pedobacter cryoconitis]
MKLKVRITKQAFKLHGWLGLTAGVFLLLYGLSGSALMFRTDLDRYFNPELHQLNPTSSRLSIDHIYRSIAQTHPDLKKIVLHDFPADRYDCYEFMLYKNQQSITENYLYFVFVNPYTGEILNEGSYQDITPSFFRWLYSFHYSLQLGMPGKLFSAIIGLIMLLSLITGTIIYRKHFWDALRFKAGLNFKNKRTTISSLHRIVGVWAVLFNALLFFTGFWMNKEHFKPSAWKLNPPVTAYEVSANLDQVLESARLKVSGFKPIAINIPTARGQDIVVRGKLPSTSFFLHQGKASGLSFDAVNGKFKSISDIDQKSFSDRFEWEVYQFHIGHYGGDFIRWLYVILGLSPGLLSITGAILWWKRTGKKITFYKEIFFALK